MALLGDFMFIDHITFAVRADLQTYLIEHGYVDEDGNPDIHVAKIPVSYYLDGKGKKAKEVTISLLRNVSNDDTMFISGLFESGVLRELGRVQNGEYVFLTDEDKELYESLRKVGKHREMVLSYDLQGNVILDENGDTVKVPSDVTYMQGLFA